MWLGIFFGIIAEFLGIEIIYKAKIFKDDSDEIKIAKKKSKMMGIAVLIIGSLLVLFCFLLAFF